MGRWTIVADSPYIPLVGGKYDGKKVYDPKMQFCEEDRISIMSEEQVHDDCYLINEKAEGISTDPNKRVYGTAHVVYAQELV
jgi:hypothetical protein